MSEISCNWRSANLVGHLDIPITSKNSYINDRHTQEQVQERQENEEESNVDRMKRWCQQRLSAHAGNTTNLKLFNFLLLF